MLSPSPPALPLGLAEFAARLDRLASFETAPFVAVAVSGGPDSLALAILADKWARQRGGGIRALCVDHRLRPESEAETSRVAGWLAARSICHQILVWEGKNPKPVSRKRRGRPAIACSENGAAPRDVCIS